MKIAHHLTRNRLAAVATTLFVGLCASSIQAQTSLTHGQFAVNDAGAATYSIPLTVAPGVGGFSPKLTLQYGSHAPNGVFGVGWSLSGVSSIARCAKSPAEDGYRIGVKNDASDLFCLDGQKLRVSNAGVYGAAGTQYRTAIDIYGRITSLGNVAGGPQSFTLEAKTGEIYTFGGTSDSRLEHPDKAVIRSWMVSEIKDRFNNRIFFTYSKNTILGEQLLSRVEYSNGRIEFSYEARPANDQILKYDDGVEYGSTNHRVSAITVMHKPLVNNTLTATVFRNYRLQYTQSQASKRSMLRSIQECVADGPCLPAITVAYRDAAVGAFVARGSQIKGVFSVDENGTGIRVLIPGGPNAPTPGKGETTELAIGTWDIDSDGRTDRLIQRRWCSSTDSYDCRSWDYFKLANGGSSALSASEKTHCFADLDGDGYSEHLGISSRSTTSSLSNPITREVFDPKARKISIGIEELAWATCSAVDFEGDGISSFVIFAESRHHSKGSAYSSRTYSLMNGQLQIQAGLGNDSPKATLDLNGDGKQDLLVSNDRIIISKGTIQSRYELPKERFAPSGYSFIDNTNRGRCTGDFDGDGRSDFLFFRYPFNIVLSRNITSESVATARNSRYTYEPLVCDDFNGDGLTDFYAADGQFFINSLPADIDRMIAVNNGADFVQEVAYKSISDNTVYSKGTGAVKPQIDIQTPLMVVDSVRSGNDAQGWNTTSYRYAHLRADLQRNGTQGFERVTSTDQGTGVSVATHYHQSHPLTGQVARVHKFVGSEAAPQTLENTTHGYLTRTLSVTATQVIQVHLNQSTSTVFDLRQPSVLVGTQRKVIDSIDAYGFPVQERTESLDSSGGVTSVSTATHQYNHQESAWLLGQLVRTTTSAQNQRSLPATGAPN